MALASGQIVLGEEVEKLRSQIRRREAREGTETLTGWGKGHRKRQEFARLIHFERRTPCGPLVPAPQSHPVLRLQWWLVLLPGLAHSREVRKMGTRQGTKACTLTWQTAHRRETAAGVE